MVNKKALLQNLLTARLYSIISSFKYEMKLKNENEIYIYRLIVMKIKTRYGIIKKKRNVMKKRKKLNFIENKR